MGFPRDRVSRAVLRLGTQHKKVQLILLILLQLILMLSYLVYLLFLMLT